MALPYSGNFMAANGNPADYAGALKWGTGASPVYAQFGEGPPLGMEGRNPERGIDTPYPQQLLDPDMFGYTMEDVLPTADDDYMQTDVPANNLTPEITRRDTTTDFPPPRWLARPNGPSGSFFRSVTAPGFLKATVSIHQFPTETVTEGWEHKNTGEILKAETSDPGQYERQTSMQQVDPPEGRNNAGAVLRGTDDARDNIRTRLTGMKIKPWSEGERLGDMFPFQQDLMLRPWRYRTAGVGRENWMVANEFIGQDPIQRDPPSEPVLGTHESEGNSGPEFGYAPEDWYG